MSDLIYRIFTDIFFLLQTLYCFWSILASVAGRHHDPTIFYVFKYTGCAVPSVSGQEKYRYANVFFCLIVQISHICVRGGVGLTSCKVEQSTCGMGHEWMEFTPMHRRTPPQTKVFFALKTYIFNHCILYNIVLILYIFLRCRLK